MTPGERWQRLENLATVAVVDRGWPRVTLPRTSLPWPPTISALHDPSCNHPTLGIFLGLTMAGRLINSYPAVSDGGSFLVAEVSGRTRAERRPPRRCSRHGIPAIEVRGCTSGISWLAEQVEPGA